MRRDKHGDDIFESARDPIVRGKLAPVAIVKTSCIKGLLVCRSKRFAHHFHAYEPSARKRARETNGLHKGAEWWLDKNLQARFPYVILGKDWIEHHCLPARVNKLRKARNSSTLSMATFEYDSNPHHDDGEGGESCAKRHCARTRARTQGGSAT